MIVYLDKDFKCYTDESDDLRPVETDVFSGKCKEFIEGYRFVPEGETWVREDGALFQGEMLSPWKPYNELDNAQREYERELIAIYEESLTTVGVVL